MTEQPAAAASSTTAPPPEKATPFLEGLFDDPKLVKFSPPNPRGLVSAPFVTDVPEFMKTRKVDDLIRVLTELYSFVLYEKSFHFYFFDQTLESTSSWNGISLFAVWNSIAKFQKQKSALIVLIISLSSKFLPFIFSILRPNLASSSLTQILVNSILFYLTIYTFNVRLKRMAQLVFG